MWLKVSLAIFAILGYVLMGYAIFGNKKKIDDMYIGNSSSLIEVILDLTYEFSPTLIRRILIFLLGLICAFIFTMGVILS
ncbi:MULTISPECIES: hypothetical protein [Peribacillus]|uniref:hypothetical protein n=1 Tax=Peribacillus TaxID=2675229 RepID=UPI001F4DF059|nr:MULTISPECIES: hypothetical protein [unclassified Peribacillus]MCK1981976.1 hypothetical protein [Peribacillus sp. Aquil_B1]MCK2007673.1 hypothetical protein [Peribacillus sp. Aquil_B8]